MVRFIPGDVHNMVHQVAGDQIFVAWVSKYCDGGTPLYSLDPVGDDVITLLIWKNTYGKDAVYLYDLFGVAGNQGSVNYVEQGYPEIGEVPYSCVWTARGKLLAGDDPATTETEATYVMLDQTGTPDFWAAGCQPAGGRLRMGAGCILTWQEDPEGLRPGQGLGPGEGWSGAIANSQTDIWYSYISYADFDLVFADDTVDTTTEMTLADYALSDTTTMPKPYVPMAMPTRLTDNAKCKGTKHITTQVIRIAISTLTISTLLTIYALA